MQKCGVVTADEDAKETPCSLMFPELVMRNHARLPALEVGIDYLPERLEIGWLRYLEDCTCQFVESTNFQRKATIWNWCGISVNLSKGNSRPLGRSMFHVVFGLPSKFLSLLELHMQRHLGWDNARVTEYITVNDDDGWVPVCHVEQGKVWKPLDAAEWELVISRSKVAAEPAVEPLSAESNGENETAHGQTTTKFTSVARDDADLACDVRALFADGTSRPRDKAIRDLAQSLGYARVGANIKAQIDTAFASAVRRGIIANTAEGLALNCRSIGEYEEAALQKQFLAALRGHNWTDKDVAILAFARWLGFARTGDTIRSTAESVIRSLVRQHRLERQEQSIRRVS